LRCRGVDRVAGRLASRLSRRARLRLQVEHGLDARHAGLLPARSRLPQLPPPSADVRADVRVQRELHSAAVARRGRARQGLARRQDAGRPLAEAREPSRAVRVHVGASRQEAAVHGRRARAVAGVELRGVARLASTGGSRPPGRADARARPEPDLPRDAGALGDRLRAGRLPLRGDWREVVNTDSTFYGGSGVGNLGAVEAEATPWHDQPFSAELTLPPLGAVWLLPDLEPGRRRA